MPGTLMVPSTKSVLLAPRLVERRRKVRTAQPLFSSTLTGLGIGGLSLLLFIAFRLSVDMFIGATPALGFGMFFLSWFVNWPHFAISYQLLYWDNRAKLLKQPRYFLAAVVVPLVLIGYSAYAATSGEPLLVGHLVEAMYFFVGWHYVKQTYGIFLLSCSQERVFFSAWTKRVLRVNLLSLWAVSFCGGNLGNAQQVFLGIPFHAWGFPLWYETVALYVFAASLAYLIGAWTVQYVRLGTVPTRNALIALLAMFVWYLPWTQHATYFITVPFFHSLQYLVIALALRRNKVRAAARELPEEEGRLHWLGAFCGYCLLAVGLGVAGFYGVPNFLDRLVPYNHDVYNFALFNLLLPVFINIHHFFIDNVLWRRDNEEMRLYLK